MRSRQIFLVKRALSKALSSNTKSTSLPSSKMLILAENKKGLTRHTDGGQALYFLGLAGTTKDESAE